MADRYLLLERSGNNKSNTSVFEMRLNGKKLNTRFGNKGQKLSKKVFKKSTISEAIALFSDKRKQKINDGYRIIKEQDKNNLNDLQNKNKNKNKGGKGNNNKNPLDQAIPLSGKSIPNPNANNKSFSFTFGQKQKNKNNRPQSQQQQRDNAKLAEIRQHLAKMNMNHKPNNSQSDDSSHNGRLKHGNPSHQNRARKPNGNGQRLKPPNGKKAKNKNKNKGKGKGNKRNRKRNKNKRNRTNSYNTESSVASSMVSYDQDDEDQENNSSTANGNGTGNGNGYHRTNGGHYEEEEEEYEEEPQMESEFDSAMASTEEPDEDEEEEEYETEVEEEVTEDEEGEETPRPPQSNGKRRKKTTDDDDEEEEDEDEEEEEDEDESGSDSESNSSVQSGRSSDDEYEMDYEKMSHVMIDALNKKVDYDSLEWKPLKVWIRFDEYHDLKGEYALAPQIKRIAGSCHELLVIYMRSKSFQHEKNTVYKRLLKLARDPEEDNKHHFETERKVSQYLYRMANMVNNNFMTRNDVCIWPVETVQFEYEGELKWATIQPPFLPEKSTNNIFVKIEPNSGKPCVDDPIVGRYQHLFSAITRGLDLIRDWQGYGVSQATFMDVCNKFNVQKEAVSQIKVRKNKNLQKQTQVLVVIDPVLTTYNAHYETNNPTDFGVKAIDEWKLNHDCIRCRCKFFHLLSANITESNPDGMQFGIADCDQYFFNKNTIKQNQWKEIQKCRYDLNIWFGDDFDQEIEKYHKEENVDDYKTNDNDNNDNDNNNDINDSSK